MPVQSKQRLTLLGTNYYCRSESDLNVPMPYMQRRQVQLQDLYWHKILTINGIAQNLLPTEAWTLVQYFWCLSLRFFYPGRFSGNIKRYINWLFLNSHQPTSTCLPNGSSGISRFRTLAAATFQIDWSKIPRITNHWRFTNTDAFSIEAIRPFSGIKTFSNDLW